MGVAGLLAEKFFWCSLYGNEDIALRISVQGHDFAECFRFPVGGEEEALDLAMCLPFARQEGRKGGLLKPGEDEQNYAYISEGITLSVISSAFQREPFKVTGAGLMHSGPCHPCENVNRKSIEVRVLNPNLSNSRNFLVV